MTTLINYTYEADEKEIKLAKLQNICSMAMELIEAYEELRGQAPDEEIDEAIAEETAKMNEAENEIIRITWGA